MRWLRQRPGWALLAFAMLSAGLLGYAGQLNWELGKVLWHVDIDHIEFSWRRGEVLLTSCWNESCSTRTTYWFSLLPPRLHGVSHAT